MSVKYFQNDFVKGSFAKCIGASPSSRSSFVHLMMHILRVNSEHEDFKMLAQELEAELRIRDGDDGLVYAQLNEVGYMSEALLAYEEGKSIACVALRLLSAHVAEIKRMYVQPPYRGRGIASRMLIELEQWALESGFKQLVLETGKNQPEAIRLYQKEGYTIIPNFGKYGDSANSICFKKELGDR